MALARIPVHDPASRLDLAAFSAGISGTIIRPEDAAYDEARQVQSAWVDRRPAIIVKAAGSDDVAKSVAFAKASGREIAVRSGGHSVAGYGVADDAVVVDLSAMKGLHIDPDRRLAWAGPASPPASTVRRGRPRPGDALRRHELGRSRWDHARRRHRLARAEARTGHRQPRVGRDRPRRRLRRHRERVGAPGPVLGRPRRRRQLRDRHPLPVPPPPGRPRPGRRALPPGDEGGPPGPRPAGQGGPG